MVIKLSNQENEYVNQNFKKKMLENDEIISVAKQIINSRIDFP